MVERSTALRIQSMVAAPVRAAGTIVGLVHFVSHRHRPLDAQALSLTEALCTQVGSFLVGKKAQEMQQRLVAVLEMTSDFVAMVGGNGRTLFLNRAARTMLEIPDLEVTSISMLDYMPRAAADELRARLRGLVASGGERLAGELVYRSRSGREIPVSQVVVVRATPEREVLFYAAVARDISESKKVERMKNEFEGGVVGTLDDAALEIVQIARTNSDRLIRLINDMLDLDKIEAGKLEMVVTETAAAALASSAIGSVRGMAAEAGVSLESDVDPSTRVRADVDRVVQVLTNLVSSAVSFTPRGGTVTLRARGTTARRALRGAGHGAGDRARARRSPLREVRAARRERHARKGGHGSTFWFELARVTATLPRRRDRAARRGRRLDAFASRRDA